MYHNHCYSRFIQRASDSQATFGEDGEQVLPGELSWSIGVLSFERFPECSAGVLIEHIAVVDFPDGFELTEEAWQDTVGEHCDSILFSLSLSDKDQVFVEIDVFYAKRDAFCEAEA